jgi:hypothetical protein
MKIQGIWIDIQAVKMPAEVTWQISKSKRSMEIMGTHQPERSMEIMGTHQPWQKG